MMKNGLQLYQEPIYLLNGNLFFFHFIFRDNVIDFCPVKGAFLYLFTSVFCDDIGWAFIIFFRPIVIMSFPYGTFKGKKIGGEVGCFLVSQILLHEEIQEIINKTFVVFNNITSLLIPLHYETSYDNLKRKRI